MEIGHLQCLVLVAETGSLTRAAERLNLSSAAVYKQLKSLEEELGVILYQRAGRRLRLTEAGTILLPFSKSLLAQRDAAIAAIEEFNGLKRGTVRIGTGPAASSYLLPRLLRRYGRTFPSVELATETGNRLSLVKKLAEGVLDLALVPSSLQEGPTISVEASWIEEWVLVGKQVHVPRDCFLRDLGNFPFILYGQGTFTDRSMSRYFAQGGFTPRISMRFDNSEAIKAMVLKGQGLALLPFWVVEADIREGAIAIIRQKDPPLSVWLTLLRHKSNEASPAMQAFIDLARTFKWSNPHLTRRHRKA